MGVVIHGIHDARRGDGSQTSGAESLRRTIGRSAVTCPSGVRPGSGAGAALLAAWADMYGPILVFLTFIEYLAVAIALIRWGVGHWRL
ncbi:hypothetical protein AB0L82_31420 [Nocardia sp. NPDC052001]|uniref:hypothetical protein n=1 Tax=Nocardia sp. NPDC052001 TaxID=3154853 RepID=UPI00343CE153